MQILIEKEKRRLSLVSGCSILASLPISLGREPVGAKAREGDGKTPEGIYRICLIKENGKYGRSLGLSYPSVKDAQAAYDKGWIDAQTLMAIQQAQAENRRPPWGSPLGGEIYIHEGGSGSDWTQGCIALNVDDMDVLWKYRNEIDEVVIKE